MNIEMFVCDVIALILIYLSLGQVNGNAMRHLPSPASFLPQSDPRTPQITPAVFLELDQQQSTENSLVWTNSSAGYYIQGDIESTDNGRVRINKAGFYFLFSSILFDTYSAPRRPNMPVVAYHGIKLYKFAEEKTIIFNKLTLGRDVVQPSHTGPVFYRLEVGDEVQFVVNNVDLIYDSQSNFINVVYQFD